MIQRYEIYHCTNCDKHKDEVWVRMNVGQFDPSRRITLHCPECGSSIAIDYTTYVGRLLTSEDINETK